MTGRLQTLSIPRGSFSYAFDGPTGNLASVTGPGGSIRSYDYQGSLLSSVGSDGPMSGSAAWTYDNNYRTTGRTVNGSNGISFGYDPDDLVTAVGSLTMGRNAQNGLLTGTTLGSVTDALTYSTFGELSGYMASAGASQLYSEGGGAGTAIRSYRAVRILRKLVMPAKDLSKLSRRDKFKAIHGCLESAGSKLKINPHVLDRLGKSGRRHIEVEDLTDALQSGSKVAGEKGTSIHTNTTTGTRWILNDANNEVVGVWPKGFL